MINQDKIYHLIAGALSALIPVEPMLFVIFFAFGKELYDYYYSDKHTCDGLDAIATIVGGLVMLTFLGN